MAGAFDGQPVDVGAPEEASPPHGSHSGQPAVVRQDADGVRRESEYARRVARREQVVWVEQHGDHLRIPGNKELDSKYGK